MPNLNKQKGTRFEYDVLHALQMLSFTILRAYSSVGTADIIASPPWNSKGNYRGLLIQAKDTKAGDYVDPFERDHLDYLQQINSGMVCLFFKKDHKCYVKIWDSREILDFDTFILKHYGIPCNYSELLTKFRNHERPIHLYAPEKEVYIGKDGTEKSKFVAPFADPLSKNVYYPHVPEKHREKHEKVYNK